MPSGLWIILYVLYIRCRHVAVSSEVGTYRIWYAAQSCLNTRSNRYCLHPDATWMLVAHGIRIRCEMLG